MLGTLNAEAIVDVEGVQYEVFAAFDLDSGVCRVSEEWGDAVRDPLSARVMFTDEIYLREVSVTSPNDNLFADTLGPFTASSSATGDAIPDPAIRDSHVAKVLSVSEVTEEHGTVHLTPFVSKLDFRFVELGSRQVSELFLYCEPKMRVDCTIRVDGYSVRVRTFRADTSLVKYVHCESTEVDLGAYLGELRTAISLFLGKKAFSHFWTTREGMSINLSQPDRIVSFGPLCRDARNHASALQKLVSHAQDKQYHFLIEAFSNSAPLEVRLLNAFVHLEILMKSRSLSQNEVSEVLGVSPGNARGVIELRNIMVHEGRGVREAIPEAVHRARSKSANQQRATFLEEALATESPHGYAYCALMDLLSSHLAQEIGVPAEWVTQKGPIRIE